MPSPSDALVGQQRLLAMLSSQRGLDVLARGLVGANESISFSAAMQLVVLPLLAAADLGAPYYASADACTLVQSAASSLPLDVELTPELLPTPNGYWRFAVPLRLGSVAPEGDLPALLSTMTWAHTRLDVDGRPLLVRDPQATLASADSLNAVFSIQVGGPQDVPVPVGSFGWRVGETLAAALDAAVVGADAPIVAETARLLAAALLFVAQRVVIVSDERPDRPERRRFEREFPERPEPVIRVVQLPRRSYTGQTESDHPGVGWSVRWLVAGHWRRQYLPSSGGHRPTYINPYLKGPDDKPLRVPTTTLYRVQPVERSRRKP